ncbi:MAG: sugar phosphate isomerase/epimerase family protein [Phycisphaerales bacterium]
MLLTLSDVSFRAALSGSKPKLTLADLPTLAKSELGLNGLVLHTQFLAGWDTNKLEQFRDRADKAAAPCLLLVEAEPQRIGDADPANAMAADERMQRVLQVAHRLGCSSVALGLRDPGPNVTIEALGLAIKKIVQRAERLELNLLLAPCPGVTQTPEKLTALIRKIGGFRVGSFPDFETASSAIGGAKDYLRALTPYASVVSASFQGFDASGASKGFDFAACVHAVESVGFDQTISLEYRGNGDPREAIEQARASFESLAKEEPAKDDDADEEA